ncbi:hypothetical protein Tco_0458017 [Tanacetum coccineum]
MENTNPPTSPDPSTLLVIEKIFKLNSLLESLNLVQSSSVSNIVCKKEKDSDVMLIELIKRYDDSNEEELEENDNLGEEKGLGAKYFDKFLAKRELAYHKNKEDKRKGVDYVMSKILGFYKECLDLGLKYRPRLEENGSGNDVDNKGGVIFDEEKPGSS